MTKDYYGTKRITAFPRELRGRAGYGVIYSDGYQSWSPKDVFEAAYQPVTAMSFGHALVALKAGARVARAGWNGKGMWLKLTPGSSFEARHAKCGHAAAYRAAELDSPEGEIELLPHIDMRAADGSLVIGWLASQTDMLADDWMVVE